MCISFSERYLLRDNCYYNPIFKNHFDTVEYLANTSRRSLYSNPVNYTILNHIFNDRWRDTTTCTAARCGTETSRRHSLNRMLRIKPTVDVCVCTPTSANFRQRVPKTPTWTSKCGAWSFSANLGRIRDFGWWITNLRFLFLPRIGASQGISSGDDSARCYFR